MLGTSRLPLVAMACTMPRPIASCVFHRSWLASPGTMNSAARRASAALFGGSVIRGSIGPRRLLGFLGVAALELLDAAGGIDDLLLAGVVRMGLGGDLNLDDRIFAAVFPFHRLATLGVDRRAPQKAVIGAGVQKDHRPVVGMYAWFHERPCFTKARIIQAFLAAAHRIEELGVRLGGLQLVDQEFGRLELIHREEQLPQHPDLLQDRLLNE